MLRRPPRSTLFPYTTPSDLLGVEVVSLGRHVRRVLGVPTIGALVVGTDPLDAAPVGVHLVHRGAVCVRLDRRDRKSTRLNSSHMSISYAVFCLKKKKETTPR